MGSWVSGMEISSSHGLKKPIKLACGLNFKGFFNPRYEDIPIPETRPIRKSYISKLILTLKKKYQTQIFLFCRLNGL